MIAAGCYILVLLLFFTLSILPVDVRPSVNNTRLLTCLTLGEGGKNVRELLDHVRSRDQCSNAFCVRITSGRAAVVLCTIMNVLIVFHNALEDIFSHLSEQSCHLHSIGH